MGHRGVCECAGRRDGTQPSRLQGRCGFEGAPWLTQVVPLALGVLVDVLLRKAAKENAVETGMESVQVGTTHVTDARLGLGRETSGRAIFGERILYGGRRQRAFMMDNGEAESAARML